jgi:hypothetical protein
LAAMVFNSCFCHLKYTLGYKINFGIKQRKLPIMFTKPEASTLYSNVMFRPVKDYEREKKQSTQA